ncbi:MAG: alpha-galactosidase, partial [Blautia sp.]|nr:alpha-galactosidase [Blautia sp.]
TYTLRDIQVRISLEEALLRIFVTAESSPVTKIRLRWLFPEGLHGTVLGDAWERSYGDLCWQTMLPYKTHPWYFLLKNEEGTYGYGVKVRPKALCSWQIDPSGITLWLDLRSGGDGVLLSGRTLCAAEVVSSFSPADSFTATCQFLETLCTDPLLPPFPVYGSNNWYYAYGKSSQEEILADADFLSRLTQGCPARPTLVIDDGWQERRLLPDGSLRSDYNGGPWVPNPRFGDMKSLAEAISKKGIYPGIWVRLLQDERNEIPQSLRLPHTGALDPSCPEVLDLIQKDIRTLGEWGYKVLKHDFSTFDIFGRWGFSMDTEMAKAGWHFKDQSRTSAEIILALYTAILEAAEPYGMLILGCNTIGHLGAGLMHLNRTGDDTSGLLWERSLRMGVNTLAFRLPQHGRFYAIDADCLGITSILPWEHNRKWGKLLASSGTPLFFSCKPDTLEPGQEAELRSFLLENAASQLSCQTVQPLDWEETPLPMHWKAGDEALTFPWYEKAGLTAGSVTPAWDDLFPQEAQLKL